MLSVKEKLRFIHRIDEALPAPRRDAVSSTALSQLGLLPVVNEYGSFYLREKRYLLDFSHGGQLLADFLRIDHKHLVCINKQHFSPDICSKDFIFFDTETTGLAGGSGTCIFLIGLAYFENDCFVVKQFLLADYQNEYAFLHHLINLLENYRGIISFNGKSYDISILKTRFILNRLHVDLERFVHIDLLYCARRLWKKQVNECSLANLEKKVLGFVRQDDIASQDIPAKYFAFLKTGIFELLTPLFKHNCIDIISTVSLAVVSSKAFDGAQHEKAAVQADTRSLFKVYVSLQDYHAAFRLLSNSYNDEDAELLLDYSFLLKKRGNYGEAVKVWEHLVSQVFFVERAYLELAKYYEHKSRIYSKALDIIQRVQKRREVMEELGLYSNVMPVDAWQHRKKRLLAKITNNKMNNSVGKTA